MPSVVPSDWIGVVSIEFGDCAVDPIDGISNSDGVVSIEVGYCCVDPIDVMVILLDEVVVGDSDVVVWIDD